MEIKNVLKRGKVISSLSGDENFYSSLDIVRDVTGLSYEEIKDRINSEVNNKP
jgi:hypothetical protein